MNDQFVYLISVRITAKYETGEENLGTNDSPLGVPHLCIPS